MTRSQALPVGLAALLLTGIASATTVTMSSDFESPTFAVGDISNDPNATGQGGWGGYNSVLVNNQLVRARISDQQAHSGTQSLRTTGDERPILKALDNSQGEYPLAGAFFSLNASLDWWVQAWVRMDSGGSGVALTLSNALAGCPLLKIPADGIPYANTCLAQDINQSALGPGAFDQWLLLRLVHTVDMGQTMKFSISGPGIDRDILLSPYSGPGSGSPVYLGLSGEAYWDDVSAGTGAAPAAVPLPATGWLLATGVGGLLGRRASGRRGSGGRAGRA